MMQTRGTMFVTEAQVGALMRVTFGQVPQDLAKRSKSSLTQNSQKKLTSQVQISQKLIQGTAPRHSGTVQQQPNLGTEDKKLEESQDTKSSDPYDLDLLVKQTEFFTQEQLQGYRAALLLHEEEVQKMPGRAECRSQQDADRAAQEEAAAEEPNVPINVIDKDASEEEIEAELEKNPWSLPPCFKEDSPEAAETRALQYRKVAFIGLEDPKTSIPTDVINEKQRGPNVSMRIEGGNRNFHMAFRLSMRDPNSDKQLPAVHAIFQVGHDEVRGVTSAIEQVRVDGEWQTANKVMKEVDRYYRRPIHMVYNKVSVGGTGHSDGPPAYKQVLARFSKLAMLPGEKNKAVMFWQYCRGIESQAFSDVQIQQMRSKDAASAFAAYRVPALPRFAVEKAFLRTRKQIFHDSGKKMIIHRSRNFYEEPDIGVLYQSQGFKNEELYNTARSEVFQTAFHTVAFTYAGVVGMGFAYLRGKTELMKMHTGDLTTPRSTESVIVEFPHPKTGRQIKLSGNVVPNYQKAGTATMIIHIETVPRDFDVCATHADVSNALNWMGCKARLDPEEEYSRITFALQCFYNQSIYKLMSDVFVGLNGHATKSINPTTMNDMQQQQIIKDLLADGKLNAEQAKVIKDMFNLLGGVGLLQGGALTGKTETIAKLAAGYQKAGLTVVILTKTHGATNNIYERIATQSREQGLPKPVRFFREANERQWLRDSGQPQPDKVPTALEEAAILLAEATAETTALKQRTDHKERHRFQKPVASVAQAIMDEYIMPEEGDPKPLMIRDKQSKENDYQLVYRDDSNLVNKKRQPEEQSLFLT